MGIVDPVPAAAMDMGCVSTSPNAAPSSGTIEERICNLEARAEVGEQHRNNLQNSVDEIAAYIRRILAELGMS